MEIRNVHIISRFFQLEKKKKVHTNAYKNLNYNKILFSRQLVNITRKKQQQCLLRNALKLSQNSFNHYASTLL